MSYRESLEAFARTLATERPYLPEPHERELELAMITYLTAPRKWATSRGDFVDACNAYDEKATKPRTLWERLVAWCFIKADA